MRDIPKSMVFQPKHVISFEKRSVFFLSHKADAFTRWVNNEKKKINGHEDVASNVFLYLFKIVIFCCEFIGVGIRLFKVMHWHTCSLHWICCYLRQISYDSCLVQKCFSCSFCQRRLLFCQIYINLKPEKPTINTYQIAKGSLVFSLSPYTYISIWC